MTTASPLHGPVATTASTVHPLPVKSVRGYVWALTVTALGLAVLFWGAVEGLAYWLQLWKTPHGIERVIVECLCGGTATVAGFGLLVRAQGPEDDPPGRAGDEDAAI